MNEYFSKPKSLGASLRVELDFSNYATKTNLKNSTGFDSRDFVKKNDLARLKSNVRKLGIDNWKMYQII